MNVQYLFLEEQEFARGVASQFKGAEYRSVQHVEEYSPIDQDHYKSIIELNK